MDRLPLTDEQYAAQTPDELTERLTGMPFARTGSLSITVPVEPTPEGWAWALAQAAEQPLHVGCHLPLHAIGCPDGG